MPAPILEFKPDANEARLLERLKLGNDEALAELYQMNRTMVIAHVTRSGGSVADAEDLLQEAVIVLWERVRAGTFEQTAKISTFLFSVVKHQWSRRLVRQRKMIAQDETEHEYVSDEPATDEWLIDEERRNAITNAMNKLGDPCKTLLLMFYWEEKSMEEIAAALGFANADTAKSKKYQCKKSLEGLLKGML